MTYDPLLAMRKNEEYCREKQITSLAPRNGICFRCRCNIYEAKTAIENIFGEEKEVTTGITVEEASSRDITGCPHCHASFCD